MSARGFECLSNLRTRERFHSLYHQGEPDECWPWGGSIHPRGPGLFSAAPSTTVVASRVAWMLAHGDIPCDNPACVNPAHLFLGTATDNNRDRMSKGRSAVGERAGRARLTEAGVLFARWMYDGGAGQIDLARALRVGCSTIHFAVTGASWRHLGPRVGVRGSNVTAEQIAVREAFATFVDGGWDDVEPWLTPRLRGAS